MSARSPALPRAKAWRAGRRRMRDAACGAPAVSNYLADPICTIPEFAIGPPRCGVLSCPRGAPRDARVAGTPLRRPMTTASYGSLLSRGRQENAELPPPHHGGLQPGDREVHQGRHDGQDGDSGHHDVHLADVGAILDEIAEPQIGRLELAHDHA